LPITLAGPLELWKVGAKDVGASGAGAKREMPQTPLPVGRVPENCAIFADAIEVACAKGAGTVEADYVRASRELSIAISAGARDKDATEAIAI